MERFKDMSYKEFKEYGNIKACEGNWSMDEVLLYVFVVDEISKVKVKGLFNRRKRLEEVQEKAWEIFKKNAIKD